MIRNKYILLLLIFVAAFSLRTVTVKVFHSPVIHDLLWNDSVGINLAEGHGYTATVHPPYIPAIFRTPGYPLFLAGIYKVFGHSYFAVFMAQAVLDSLTAVLVAFIGFEAVGLGVGVASGFAYAFYPYAAAFCSVLHQDLLLTFFATLVVLFTIKLLKAPASIANWCAAGAATSAMVLTKQYLLPLAAIPLAVLLVKKSHVRQKLRGAAIFFIAFAMLSGPWLWRNYRVFHRFPLYATGAFGLNMKLIVTDLDHGEEAFIEQMSTSHPEATREEYLADFVDGQALVDKDNKEFSAGIGKLARRWPEVLLLSIKNVPRLWITRYARWSGFGVTIMATGVSILVVLFGLLGMVRAWPYRHTLWPAYAIVFLVTAMHAPLMVESRYTLPARPAIMVFIGVFLVSVWERFRRPAAEQSAPVRSVTAASAVVRSRA